MLHDSLSNPHPNGELISDGLLIVSTSPPISLISSLSWLRDGRAHLAGFKLVSLFIPLIDYVHLLNSALHSLHWCFTITMTPVWKATIKHSMEYFTVDDILLRIGKIGPHSPMFSQSK